MRRALLVLLLACAPVSDPDVDAGAAIDAGTDVDAGPEPLCRAGAPTVEYPEITGFEVGEALPRLQREGLSPEAVFEHLDLADGFEPCAGRSRLLVLRSVGSWCGPCLWHAKHTSELEVVAGRVKVIDLLVGDEDHFMPDEAALRRWQALLDAPATVLPDPDFTLGPVAHNPSPLPRFVVLDSRTMEIRFALAAPDPEVLLYRLRRELAILDDAPEPDFPSLDRFDDRFDRLQWDLIRDIAPPGAPPPDPTNEVADDPAAAALGEALFFDSSLSPSGSVSCATCHAPEMGFADDAPTSTGVAPGDRNAPSVLFAAHARWQFLDGRADTLWTQAVAPFENPVEFGSSRSFVARALAASHAEAWASVFGPLPPLDEARLPDDGRPGMPAWDAMSEDDRALVTGVLVNAGKALAAFQRTLTAKPNRLDAYAAGDLTALTPAEKDGLHSFFTAGCIQCHYGPRLTDDAFHNVRFPSGRQDGAADRGLADGFTALLLNPLSGTGAFSAAPSSRVHTGRDPGARALGAFRTPPLRGIVHTAPYGHGGTHATLEDVVRHYADRGAAPGAPDVLGEIEPWVPRFATAHQAEIVTFLKVLEAAPAGD